MNEQKLIDMVIVERINMLLYQRCLSKKEGCKPEPPFIEKAESILSQLPKEEWDILNEYMEYRTLEMADNESYLYSCGLSDGVRIMKYIKNL